MRIFGEQLGWPELRFLLICVTVFGLIISGAHLLAMAIYLLDFFPEVFAGAEINLVNTVKESLFWFTVSCYTGFGVLFGNWIKMEY